MGAHGLDTFVYGPKNDPYHRDRWREPYPDAAIADFRATARVARRARVRFVVAVSPGLDVCFAGRDDFAALTAKLGQLARAHVRHFALFFDDVGGGLSKPEDVARYGGTDQETLARAHADLTNRTDRWLRRRRLPGLVFMVPSDYGGTECRPYHRASHARAMPADADRLVRRSPETTAAARRAFRACPATIRSCSTTPGTTRSSSNRGCSPAATATRARPPRPPPEPMTQAHASLIAIGTAAAYFAAPDTYEPESAWHATLAELDPRGGLAVLADQTRSSPLDLDDAHALAVAVDAAAASYATPAWHDAMDALDAEIAHQGAAPAMIAASLGGTPLGDEIAPWVAELAAHAAAETDAVRLLRAMKPDLVDVTATARSGTLRVTGRAVPPDDRVVAALAPIYGAVPPLPTLGELFAKGNVLPDVALCPELGLNVHGKVSAGRTRSPSCERSPDGTCIGARLVASQTAAYAVRRRPGGTESR